LNGITSRQMTLPAWGSIFLWSYMACHNVTSRPSSPLTLPRVRSSANQSVVTIFGSSGSSASLVVIN